MLISEKIIQRFDISETDEQIATTILELRYEIESKTIRQVASQALVSPASVIRFSKALGFKGFDEFKKEYLKELMYLDASPSDVDANVPFMANDSPLSIANKIAALHEHAVSDTKLLLTPEVLNKLRALLENVSSIHVFSQGTLLNDAESFREKMMKVGMFVSIPSNLNFQQYEAGCLRKDDLAIILSYSGETSSILQVARILRARKVTIVSLTSLGENSLAKLSDYVLHLATREQLIDNIGDFEIHVSAKYLLDVIYSLYFSNNYEKCYKEKLARSRALERTRFSSSETLLNRRIQ